LLLVFVGLFLFGAGFAASLFPRATAVPFILGGWLPFLWYLSGAGRQLRAPLIVGLFALISVLSVVLGDNHSVRRIDANKTAGGNHRHKPHPARGGSDPMDAGEPMASMRRQHARDR